MPNMDYWIHCVGNPATQTIPVILISAMLYEKHKKSPYEAFFGLKCEAFMVRHPEILVESNQVEGSYTQDTYDDTTDHTKNYKLTYDTIR